LIFYAARSAVERHVERSTGRPVLAPVRFSLGMDMSTPAAQAWSRGLRYLRDEIVNASPSLADPTAVRHLEQLMLGGLLAAQRHNYRDDAAVRPAVSRTVRQACSLINDRIGEQLSASDVADALQVSLRALQDGFRRDLQTSMSAYIRDRRLDRAHRALGEVGSTSVTEVACDLGITHLGRFSVQYKARFGQSPSETLAQH
jgi:AraC-like DNA-binding protein